jgi:hypothetical protein
MKAMQGEQRRLSITVERLTISVEEEARDVISYRLSKELGIEIKLDRLFIKGERSIFMAQARYLRNRRSLGRLGFCG